MMDEAKFPPKPYYPWLILPWNVKDDEEDNLSESEKQQFRIGIIMDDKEGDEDVYTNDTF